MVFEQFKQDVSVRKTLIESRFANGHGGHRFWLFVLNILGTWFAVAVFFVWMFDIVGALVVLMLFVVFAMKFDINNAWRFVSGGKR